MKPEISCYRDNNYEGWYIQIYVYDEKEHLQALKEALKTLQKEVIRHESTNH